jgi:hypothetical protein
MVNYNHNQYYKYQSIQRVKVGLLGIAVTNNSTAVFFYYSDSPGGGELRNRVYRYEWNGQTLVLDRRVITTIASAVKPNCFFIRLL